MDFESRFGHCITQCEHIIRHTFGDRPLAAESLNNAGQSASFHVYNHEFKLLPKNDRLAVYGDSIAATTLCLDWYRGNTSKGGVAWANVEYCSLH